MRNTIICLLAISVFALLAMAATVPGFDLKNVKIVRSSAQVDRSASRDAEISFTDEANGRLSRFERFEVQVNTFTASDQSDPAIARLPDGGVCVVWNSRRQQAGTSGIYMQRYSRSGQAIGREQRVNLFTHSMQTKPAVVADSTGAIWIAWESFGQDGSYNAIMARRFAGERLQGGDEILVNESTAGNQADVVAMVDDLDKVTFFWVTPSAGGKKQIAARSFDPTGTALGGERLLADSERHQHLPSVAANQNFSVAVWAELDRFGVPAGIVGRIVSVRDGSLGNVFTISPDDGRQHIEPAVAVDSLGQIVVTWHRTAGNEYEVVCRRFNEQGAPLNECQVVSAASAKYVSGATVAIDSRDDTVVMWNQQDDEIGREINVWAQQFDSQGNRIGERFLVNRPHQGRHQLSAASGKNRLVWERGGDGRLWVCWHGANEHDESSVNLTALVPGANTFSFAPPTENLAFTDEAAEDGARPHEPPTFDPKLVAEEPFGGFEGLGPPGPDFGFIAINATGWNPPDPVLAAGPTHLVAMTNGAIAFFTKTGTLTFSDEIEGPQGFWGAQGATGFVFDPEVLFDPHSNRFIAMACERNPSNRSFFLLAVSDDDNPNGNWFKYRIDVTDISDFNIDSPNLAVDDEVVYLGADFFSPDMYLVYMLRKSDLLVGGSIVDTSLLITGSQSYGMPLMYDTNAPAFYMIQAFEFGNFSTVRLHAVTNPLGTPQRVTFDLSVPAYGHPQDPQQQGTTIRPELFEARFWSCVYRNGSLWAVHHHSLNSVGTPRARWYEIEMNNWPVSGQVPQLVQSGELTPVNSQGQTSSTFFPSIWVDDAGNAAITMARSSTSEFISMSRAVRSAGMAPGLFQDVQLVQASTSPFTLSGRWGDYSGTVSDPVEANTFWGIHEFASATNVWHTRVAKYVVQPSDATVVPSGFNVTNGTHVAGVASDLGQSDNVSVEFLAAPMNAELPREIAVDFNGNIENTTFVGMSLIVESRVNSPNITQTVELFNFIDQEFEQVSSVAGQLSDTEITINVQGDLSRFHTPGSGLLVARVSYASNGPTLFFPWKASIDRLVWRFFY